MAVDFPGFPQDLWNLEEEIEPGVAHTARWTAAMRAIEHERPDALFKDPLARALAGEASLRQWQSQIHPRVVEQPYSRSHIAIRCRALDDLIIQEIDDMEFDEEMQVVSIGAGMCTRPWRLTLPDIIWFEVDRPDIIRLKSKIIKQKGVSPTVGGYVAVGADLSDESVSLTQALEAKGFNPRLPTVFVMEGMLCYLSEEDLEDLINEIQELSRAGRSRMVLTCINGAFLMQLHSMPSETSKQLSAHAGGVDAEPLFKSCWEPGCKQIFEDAGWRVVSKMSREDYGLEKLNVPMLDFGFPDPRTATEYIIVMDRKPLACAMPFDCRACGK